MPAKLLRNWQSMDARISPNHVLTLLLIAGIVPLPVCSASLTLSAQSTTEAGGVYAVVANAGMGSASAAKILPRIARVAASAVASV